MNEAQKKIILEKIREYRRIMLFRHIRCDGDCVGATKGLKEILKSTWPEKEVFLIDTQHSDYLAFLGADDEPVPDEMYADALAIVLDTGTSDRISNPKYALCREIVKIDHHIPKDAYGDYEWVEEHRSSCCEMIVDFYTTLRDELILNSRAATFLYTGMVTDSGRFRFREVSGDTMRCAAVLLDQGIDTERLYAYLYLEDFDYLKFKAYVYQAMKVTEHGVAYLYISKAMREKFGLTLEAASSAISFMDSIRGCLCWIAFIENDDEPQSIRVRLRSRFVSVNEIGERWRGGGHACACGATVYGRKEVRALLKDADARIAEYKNTHEDWL